MELIANNPYYKIQIDKASNTFYLDLLGLWKREKDIPTWYDDFRKAVTSLSKGFRALVDLSGMTGTVIPDAFVKAQHIAMEAGIGKVAEVHKTGSFVKVQVEKVSEESGLPIQRFDSREEAQEWLKA